MNTTTVARVLAALAQNDGQLSVTSAKEVGVDRQTLKRAADIGVLLRTGWGKYAALGTPPKELALKGAHLAGEALLSHRGGGYYWAMDAMERLVLEWSIPHHLRSASSLVHRRRRFDDLEVVERDGIYVTSVAQTLADLGAVCDADIVERAVESVLRRHLAEESALREFSTSRTRSRHGGPTMREVLDRRIPGERPTGSDVETICLQVLRRGGFFPRRQWAIYNEEEELLGYGDFALPPAAFILEVDGAESHNDETRQHDYSRQARIEDLGYRVRRVTASDVLWRPKYVLDVTRRGLASAPLLSQIAPAFRHERL